MFTIGLYSMWCL
ncbi:hypothetical protein VTO73DRAFT_15080 [Trametes versicolor]